MAGDPFELNTLRVDPADLGLAVKQAVAPAKIEKRSKDFVRFPMSWYERLKKPPATGVTLLVALHLLHLDWRNHGKPFTLANGMLEFDGISRQSKWRALGELEKRGLITIQRRPSKSPIVQVLYEPVRMG
jgi:hypothetical protein